jgi:hypothetical protein
MIIDKHLYIGSLPEKSAIKIVRKIKKFKLCAGVQVITLPMFNEGLLEIYDLNEFQQEYYKAHSDDIHVVGIAVTRRQAYYLVRDIIDDVYRNTGTFDCDTYFRYVL